MKTGILSDVHSNLEALTAVIADMQRRGVTRVLCLGDCVGYGADPSACLDVLFDACDHIIAGNHDLAAVGLLDDRRFNTLAKSSVEFTRSRISPAQFDRLRSLPLEVTDGDLLFVHASPVSPESFPYVKEPEQALEVFQARQFKAAFYGHTHLPLAFHQHGGGEVSLSLNPRMDLNRSGAFLINVGSVGQPRDCDPRACYVIHDSDEGSVRTHRVAYDIEAATSKINAGGLPQALGRRLFAGV